MKKYFLIVLLLFVSSCSCCFGNKNVIVGDNNICTYNDCNYYLTEHSTYRIIGPKHIVGYTTTMYGGCIPLYISDYDIDNIIIFDEVYYDVWIKENAELPSFISNDIIGFYLKYEYIDDTPFGDTLMVNFQQCSFSDIFSLIELNPEDFSRENGYIHIRDKRYYSFYLRINDYICCYVNKIYFKGDNIYIKYDNKIYQFNNGYAQYIFEIINF